MLCAKKNKKIGFFVQKNHSKKRFSTISPNNSPQGFNERESVVVNNNKSKLDFDCPLTEPINYWNARWLAPEFKKMGAKKINSQKETNVCFLVLKEIYGKTDDLVCPYGRQNFSIYMTFVLLLVGITGCSNPLSAAERPGISLCVGGPGTAIVLSPLAAESGAHLATKRTDFLPQTFTGVRTNYVLPSQISASSRVAAKLVPVSRVHAIPPHRAPKDAFAEQLKADKKAAQQEQSRKAYDQRKAALKEERSKGAQQKRTENAAALEEEKLQQAERLRSERAAIKRQEEEEKRKAGTNKLVTKKDPSEDGRKKERIYDNNSPDRTMWAPNSKALANYKEGLPPLTQEQRDMVVGMVLSDASYGGLKGGKPKYGLEFSQALARRQLMDHLYENLKDFCGQPPKVQLKATNKTKDNKTVTFRTYQHPNFKEFHDAFHVWDGPNKIVKVIPPNIEEYLTPRALAYVHMADGTTAKNVYILCVDCFPLEQSKYLTKALEKNFGIKSKVIVYHKHYFRIQILPESGQAFADLVRPYMLEDFMDKIKHPPKPLP